MICNERMVGIVIVNYKGNEDTVECIQSIQNSSILSAKIYLVDNGSGPLYQEKLAKLYERDEGICYIPLDKNMGFSGGNNVGIKKAIEEGCKYILLMNNDTFAEGNFVQPLIDAAAEKNDCTIVTGKIKFYSEKNKIWYAGGNFNSLTGRTLHFGYGREDSEQFNDVREINFSTGCLMLIPLTVINAIGMLPEHYFLYYEDNEYSLRAIENGFSITYIPDSVIYHKVSSSTNKLRGISQYYMTRNSLQICREHNKGIKKYVAYLFISMRSIKRVIEKKYDYNVMKKAFADFMKEKLGEQTI